MSQLRAAVIGVGYLGRFHAQKYKMIESCKLIGVCDVREDSAKAVAEELDVAFFTDFKDLVGKVDLVTVATTTTTHYEVAKFFLQNGVHVNVEKPIAATSAQAQELCDLAQKYNLKFQVGHIERFNPAFVAAKEKMKTPLFIECHRLAKFNPRGADVSVILDLMIHDIDVVQTLVKSPVKSVYAVGTPVLTKTVDIANARVEFENGTVANITASRVSQTAQRKFRVFQKDQYLSLDFGGGEINLVTKTGEFEGGNLPMSTESWNLDKGDALLVETKSFVNSVLNDAPPEVTGNDGLIALKLAEQIDEQIREKYC